MSTFLLVGTIVDVPFDKFAKKTKYTQEKHFVVEQLDTRSRLHCVCSFFAHVFAGDKFAGQVKQIRSSTGETQYQVVKPPLMTIGGDHRYLEKDLMRIFSQRGVGRHNIQKLLQNLSGDSKNSKDSSKCKGCGESKDPVTKLLSDSIELCENDNKDVIKAYCPPLSELNAIYLLQKWHKDFHIRRLYLLGMNNLEIKGSRMQITDLYNRCITNPFTIPSLPHNKAIDIFERQGKEITDDHIKYGLLLNEIYNNTVKRSWAGTPISYLKRKFSNFTEIKFPDDYSVVTYRDMLYLRYVNHVEQEVANFLIDTVRSPPLKTGDYKISSKVSIDQRQAIIDSLQRRVSIIIGGAGTGKTTTLKELDDVLTQLDLNPVFCAFTGKAASRLKEALNHHKEEEFRNRKTYTIHRLINLCKDVETFKRIKEVENKRKTDVVDGYQPDKHDKPDELTFPVHQVIVDESSMATCYLFYLLLTSLTKANKQHGYNVMPNITLVGDHNQLPQYGWGSLLKQVIESGCFPIIKLHTCFRVNVDSGGRSGIIENAKRIDDFLDGKSNKVELVNDTDFQMIPGGMDKLKMIIKQFADAKVEHYNKSFIIVSPFKNVNLEINKYAQDFFSIINNTNNDNSGDSDPLSHIEQRSVISWKVGDKVMMTNNNYSIDVMNGEEGRVVKVSPPVVSLHCILEVEDDFQRSTYVDNILEALNTYRYSSTTDKRESLIKDIQTIIPKFDIGDVDRLVKIIDAKISINDRKDNIKNKKQNATIEGLASGGIWIQFAGRLTTHFFRFMTSTEVKKLQVEELKDIEESEGIRLKSDETTMYILHSYGISIDKSQGSEWDYVIFYMPPKSGSFLNATRIKTGITRAKEQVIVIGDIKAFSNAANQKPPSFYEGLKYRLQEALPQLEGSKIIISNISESLDSVNPEFLDAMFDEEYPEDL